MTAPKRIQRKRTKGWRMPEGAVYVGRPTIWGNPFTVMNGHRQGWLVWDDRDRLGFVDYPTSSGFIAAFPSKVAGQQFAVDKYRVFITEFLDRSPLRDRAAIIRGRDLACWCPAATPCHADVLLAIANQEQP